MYLLIPNRSIININTIFGDYLDNEKANQWLSSTIDQRQQVKRTQRLILENLVTNRNEDSAERSEFGNRPNSTFNLTPLTRYKLTDNNVINFIRK